MKHAPRKRSVCQCHFQQASELIYSRELLSHTRQVTASLLLDRVYLCSQGLWTRFLSHDHCVFALRGAALYHIERMAHPWKHCNQSHENHRNVLDLGCLCNGCTIALFLSTTSGVSLDCVVIKGNTSCIGALQPRACPAATIKQSCGAKKRPCRTPARDGARGHLVFRTALVTICPL